jgi:hypothetical protein
MGWGGVVGCTEEAGGSLEAVKGLAVVADDSGGGAFAGRVVGSWRLVWGETFLVGLGIPDGRFDADAWIRRMGVWRSV